MNGYVHAHAGPPAPNPLNPLIFTRDPDPEVLPYPDPLVLSTEALEGPDKQAVRDLVTYAQANGWTCVVTYARGYLPHATHGTPGASPVDSLAVRMSRRTDRALGVYIGTGKAWRWETLLAQVGPLPLTKSATLAAFRNAIVQV
jgi:hypothetical protein